MPSKPSNSYQVLQRLRLKYSNDVVRCQTCSEELTMDRLTQHVKNVHLLDPNTTCPYCVGRYRWKIGTKTEDKNTRHLVECIKRYREKFRVYRESIDDAGPSNPLPTPSPETCKACRTFEPKSRDPFGRKMDRTNEYLGLHDPFSEKPYMWEVEFELFDEKRGLKNDLVGIVIRFLKGDLDWYHLMVKDDVFHIFMEEMAKISNEIVIIPYWCLCDGLTDRRVLHRHVILACEKESKFVDVWKNKVRYGSTDGSKSKYRVKIEDAFHLVNTLQYVSQRKSSCDGKRIRDEVEENDSRLSHFYFKNHLTDHVVAFLCTLFPGGLEKLCLQQNGKKNVVDWFDKSVCRYDGNRNKKWCVALKETGFKFLDCVIPLRRDLEPTEEETDVYLTWMRGRKMYLKENPELLSLSDEEWFRHQIRKGNTFRSIADELYVFSAAQQNVANQLKVMKEMNTREISDRYEQRMDRKFIHYEREMEGMKREIKTLKEENETVKIKLADCEKKSKTLKEENKKENKSLKRKITDNEKEIRTLKRRLTVYEMEIRTLKSRLTDYEKEIKL